MKRMHRTRWSAAIALAMALGSMALAGGKDPDEPLRTLITTENAFAAMSAEKGMQPAFLANLAENSVMFRPLPVNGQQWFRDRPPKPGLLTWYPSFAAVSMAGDLGYTTGPWEFRLGSDSEARVGYGHFVSVWRREADGRWKLALDHGISHAKLDPPPPPAQAPEPGAAKNVPEPRGKKDRSKQKGDAEAARASLLKAEETFSVAASAGIVPAATTWLATDARYYRADTPPFAGKTAILADLTARVASSSWKPSGSEVSRSGDLGYTYGRMERTAAGDAMKPEPHIYTHIWRRQGNGEWKVVLEIVDPLPPPPDPSKPEAVPGAAEPRPGTSGG